MSTFQVQLNNIQEGQLDINPATGAQMSPSIQRSMWVTGPNRTYRELIDGSTFTDCNYWKQYCYPQCPLNEAILVCTFDDGSVWSENPAENTFPRCYTLTLAGGSTYTQNQINVIADNGNPAISASIEQMSTTPFKVQLNGSGTAYFDMNAGQYTAKTFNVGDAVISQLNFDNSANPSTAAVVQVILTIQSVAKS